MKGTRLGPRLRPGRILRLTCVPKSHPRSDPSSACGKNTSSLSGAALARALVRFATGREGRARSAPGPQTCAPTGACRAMGFFGGLVRHEQIGPAPAVPWAPVPAPKKTTPTPKSTGTKKVRPTFSANMFGLTRAQGGVLPRTRVWSNIKC